MTHTGPPPKCHVCAVVLSDDEVAWHEHQKYGAGITYLCSQHFDALELNEFRDWVGGK